MDFVPSQTYPWSHFDDFGGELYHSSRGEDPNWWEMFFGLEVMIQRSLIAKSRDNRLFHKSFSSKFYEDVHDAVSEI